MSFLSVKVLQLCRIEKLPLKGYITSDFWDKDSLINAGFLINDNGIITLPFNDFDEKMSLVDVEYLWKMIQTLNNAAVYGKR